VVLSLPLFDIMKEDRFLALDSTCTMGLSQKSIGGFAFVDDTYLCISGQTTNWLTARQMQASVANWKGLLQIMGGTF